MTPVDLSRLLLVLEDKGCNVLIRLVLLVVAALVANFVEEVLSVERFHPLGQTILFRLGHVEDGRHVVAHVACGRGGEGSNWDGGVLGSELAKPAIRLKVS